MKSASNLQMTLFFVFCIVSFLSCLVLLRPFFNSNSTPNVSKKIDFEIVEEVGTIYEKSMPGLSAFNFTESTTCSRTCSFKTNSSMLLHTRDKIDEINDVLDRVNMSIVTRNRRIATALLTISATLSCKVGDIVETGVFTGGTSAMIMKVLKSLDNCDRKFWAFDSFLGLPPTVRQDFSGEDIIGQKGEFMFSQKDFINNLKEVDAWDDNKIIITKGWFNETAKISPVKKISFLRLDGDLYVSTWDAIIALYDRVVIGGLIYVDDYGAFNGCREAINDFRTQRKIYETMHYIKENDGKVEAIWWRKTHM